MSTTIEYEQGVAAAKNGTPWYNNPYKSGSVEAYQWDKGHTHYRKLVGEKP